MIKNMPDMSGIFFIVIIGYFKELRLLQEP